MNPPPAILLPPNKGNKTNVFHSLYLHYSLYTWLHNLVRSIIGLVKTDAGSARMLQVGTSRYRSVPAGTGCFRLVPAGAGRYRMVQVGTGWYRLVQAGSGSYRLVPAGTGWKRLVPVGTGQTWLK